MKPTLEQLQMQLAGAQALIAYTQQERDAALKVSAAAQERETATADVLDVISRSPSDLQAALDVIVQKAAALLASDNALVLRWTAQGSGELVAASLGGAVSEQMRLTNPRAAPWWGS